MNRYGFQRMGKLNNFGPVYLLNLKDHSHRLKSAKKEFEKYGISDYTIIEAVDGRDSDLSHIVEGKYPNLKPSEIGCLASHIKALKHWLDTSDSDHAIIMEDDFSFDTVQYWPFDWDYVIKNIPKSAEITQLIMIKNRPVKFSLHKKEKHKWDNAMSYEWSTACYVIKREYAKNLVKLHYINGRYKFENYGFKNQAADVILYGIGTAYSMPLFTHMLDAKNSINKEHSDFHQESKNRIDEWWQKNGSRYETSQFFDTKNGLTQRNMKVNGCFTIFHEENNDPEMGKRNILVSRAKEKLKENFSEFQTPTIIMRNNEEIKEFYKNAKIKINPKGFEGNGWKPGELGIWASNLTAWENFAKSDYDYIILMEDDIVLQKDFNNKLINYMDELPDDWDVFTAYAPPTGNVRYKVSRKDLFIGKDNVCRVYQSWSCLCYVVSKSGAKKLLKEVKKNVGSPIDHYLFYNKNLSVYTMKMEKGNICDIYRTESTVQTAERFDMTNYL